MKKTLLEFAWQITPELRDLLIALYEESPKRFTAFVFAVLQWLADGARRDSIVSYANGEQLKLLHKLERAHFQNVCNQHLAKFRDYHDGAENPKTRTAATPQSKPDNRPTREQIDKICRDNADGSRDPKIYAERVWDELIHTDWCDRNGKPITNFEAYIVKGLFPSIDKTLSETVTGDDAFYGIRVC